MILLENNAVHIWRAYLDQPQPGLDQLRQTLAQDELQRAARFAFAHDSARFIAGRGVLRAILGQYLDLRPDLLHFEYGAAGKPALAQAFASHNLCFNLAHSHGLAIYAVARGRAIGVDVERIRADVDVEQIASTAFAPAELAELLALPAAQRLPAFFACWARKEAYVKARGDGLSLPGDQFQVLLAPGAPPKLLRTEWDHQEASDWSLYDLDAGEEYAAALAAEGHDHTMTYRDWPGME
jgi:4'-phosphopantetheinyl transferase